MRSLATICHNSDFSMKFRPLSDQVLVKSLKFIPKQKIQTKLRALIMVPCFNYSQQHCTIFCDTV